MLKFEKERKHSEEQNCTCRLYDMFCNCESCITAVKLDAYNLAGNGKRCDLEWQNSSLFHSGNYPANSGLSRPDGTEKKTVICSVRRGETTVSPSSKYKHWLASALLHNIQNIRIRIGEKSVFIKRHETAINRPVDHTGET